MSASENQDNAPWGMGFELFARLVADAYAANDAHQERYELDDATIERAASTARRAVRIWHASKKSEGRP